jgi:hypothetical protein
MLHFKNRIFTDLFFFAADIHIQRPGIPSVTGYPEISTVVDENGTDR